MTDKNEMVTILVSREVRAMVSYIKNNEGHANYSETIKEAVRVKYKGKTYEYLKRFMGVEE